MSVVGDVGDLLEHHFFDLGAGQAFEQEPDRVSISSVSPLRSTVPRRLMERLQVKGYLDSIQTPADLLTPSGESGESETPSEGE